MDLNLYKISSRCATLVNGWLSRNQCHFRQTVKLFEHPSRSLHFDFIRSSQLPPRTKQTTASWPREAVESFVVEAVHSGA